MCNLGLVHVNTASRPAPVFIVPSPAIIHLTIIIITCNYCNAHKIVIVKAGARPIHILIDVNFLMDLL